MSVPDAIPMDKPSIEAVASPVAVAPRLRRVLKLWDLLYYGLIALSPIAPATVFGLALKLSGGHATISLLFGMIGTVLTALSYGRMAAVYPSAGSAYAYVGRSLNPHFGFLAGSAMLLEYLLIPIFCVVFGSLTAARLLPHVPYVVLAFALSAVMTSLNLLGIRSVAHANQILLYFMFGVFAAFILLALRYIFHHAGFWGVFSFKPIYDPKTFSLHAIVAGTSFAALNYVGFESISTMAEDAENPRRNILLALVLVCVFIGIFSCLIIYLSQIVWPDYNGFHDPATAFMDVTRRVGGDLLFYAMTLVVVIAMTSGGIAVQLGASRLLFGLGRDSVLPRKAFTYLDPKRNTPQFNIWLCGLLTLGGGLAVGYEFIAELITLAAFFGYMLVNLAVIKHFYLTRGQKGQVVSDVMVPGVGALFCLAICCGFSTPAKIAGGLWLFATLAYDAIRTRGFQVRPIMLDLEEP
jgi:putrescine importer